MRRLDRLDIAMRDISRRIASYKVGVVPMYQLKRAHNIAKARLAEIKRKNIS